MELDEYQLKAKATATYPKEHALPYLTTKLASEAGEVAGKVGKSYRGDYNDPEQAGSIQYDRFREDVLYELGDTLWYISELARYFNASLSEVAQLNLDKLRSRKERDVLKGDGDHR